MQDKYEAMPIARLREIARESHADHDPEATRIFVNRVLDMEVERRTWFTHENLGYQPFSSTAKLGEHPGGGTAAADPLAIAYDRGVRVHAAHEEARYFLEYARLRPRNLLAALIQSAKTDRRVNGPWGASYDQVAAGLGYYARMLGWPPGIEARVKFKKGQAIKRAALEGRTQMLMLARLG
ncbi:hypothetical protein [Halomonas citrativorans]|uniref:Lytic transglycosylase domain-containing protein n=1 Tax=Halomonas citrativorans TaxID=2742612 RepID=A0ABR9F9C8_9GAMM|nr:hypothetical protein [Halomonas citrativorans]MBE0403082.1 hypothetical protein [Halomonas citrativorans]